MQKEANLGIKILFTAAKNVILLFAFQDFLLLLYRFLGLHTLCHTNVVSDEDVRNTQQKYNHTVLLLRGMGSIACTHLCYRLGCSSWSRWDRGELSLKPVHE